MRARVNLPEVRKGETIVLPMDRRVEGLVRAGKLQRLRRAGSATPVTRMQVRPGTVREVLAWVGDDRDRAAAALAAEQSRPSPRVTLVSALSAMATQDATYSPLSDDDASGHPDTVDDGSSLTGALREPGAYVGIG